MSKIPVLVAEPDVPREASREATLGGTLAGGTKRGTVLREVEISKLKNSAKALTEQLAQVFADLKAVGDFKLAEVTVSVEVSAEGNVLLIGKAGISGGIELKFQP